MFGRKNKVNGEFARVARSDQVHEGEFLRVKVGKRSILLIRWERALVAIDAACPHAAADLGRGTLYRHKLYCPDHEYCFDIRSGLILWPEDENYRLKRYAAYEEDGSVFVRLD